MLPALLILAGLVPGDSSVVYDGRARGLAVKVPRLEETIRVDGVLDEPAWNKAALLTGFSQFDPIDGVPAVDSTEVLVWYSPTAIHFGFRAYEAHGEVHATLADRDRIFADDYVQVLLSTQNDGRQAYMFATNPLGVQGDGALVEHGVTGGGGFMGGTSRGREEADLSPDYVFQSKGQITPWGYQVEVRIPFKSLRYQAKDPQDWGLHLLRRVQHSGYEDSWAPASRASASFLAQSGQLTGLSGLSRGLVLDLTPEVTGKLTGSPGASGWNYDGEGPEVGGTVRWGISNNLSLNGTAKPDFSQIEADASQIQFDPRDALFFAEKRPFFLDGLEQFDTPNNLIYTRRIVQPEGAVKLTGKALGANVGFISAVDDQVGSVTGRDHPFVNVLRVQQDIGSRSKLGLAYTDRIDGDDWNRVLGIDGRAVFGRNNLGLQVAGSRTREAGVITTAPLWRGVFTRQAPWYSLRWSFNAIDPDFRARSGFIRRAGDANLDLVNILNVYGKPGSLVESFNPDISFHGTWTYDLLMNGKGVRDPKLHINLNATLKGGWGAGASVLIERFGYDPRIYTDYALEVDRPGGVGKDTVAFTGGNQNIRNLDWVLSVNTPQFSHFTASAIVIWGHDENFYEWASSSILFFDLGLEWRPTDHLRVSARYQQNQYGRRTDGTLVGRQRIPRLKLEYQIARPLFVRLIGEYNAYEQDSLRDEGRSGAPILLYDPSAGSYARASAFQFNTLHGEALVSFQPVPGTTLFAGYSSLSSDPRAFQFSGLDRLSDGFFLKASYLFRVGG